MKKSWLAFLLGLSIAANGLSASASAIENETETEVQDGAWTDYELVIDEDVYALPMMYADLTAYGWSLKEEAEAEETIEPYSYGIYTFVKEDLTVYAYLLNLGLNTVPAEDCIVAGISIDKFYWDEADSVVELPGGLALGASTAEDIVAAYGKPTDIYEGELYTQYTYQEDYNQEVELAVYLESGVLEEIQIENFAEPEGYDVGEPSTETPQSVLAYARPDVLSNDLTDYEIELEGKVYALPVPVSVLVEDGWTLDENDSDSLVIAQYYGRVTLRKDNQSFSTSVVNGEDYATTPENCWVETLEVGGYTLDMEGALPGGVSVGATEEEFLSILNENSMDYEYSESGDYHYYTYNSPSYGSGCEAVVYVGTDSFFEKDTIIEVSCENALE
ncbi:MAG: hypothetical protein LUI07_06500 [Lachnospiraceae bacterium]|nr:hypothetical protein [Lachnospiraceae bacterium]